MKTFLILVVIFSATALIKVFLIVKAKLYHANRRTLEEASCNNVTSRRYPIKAADLIGGIMKPFVLLVSAFFAAAVVKVALMIKAKMYKTSPRTSETELDGILSPNDDMPSWAGDTAKIQVFLDEVMIILYRKSVPEEVLQFMNNDPDTGMSLISMAARVERKGASFAEQQVAASELGLELAERLIAKLEERVR